MDPKLIRANRNRLSAVRSREKKFHLRDKLQLELQLYQQENERLSQEIRHRKMLIFPGDSRAIDMTLMAPFDNQINFSTEPAVFFT